MNAWPECLWWLPGLLPSLSVTPTVHHLKSEVLSLVCTVLGCSKTDEDHTAFVRVIYSLSSIIQYFWLKASVIKCWYFWVVIAPDQISGLLMPHPLRLWDRGGVLNAPHSCWSLFMCLVPVCRSHSWKIWDPLWTFAGIDAGWSFTYLHGTFPEMGAGLWHPNKRPRSTVNFVKIGLIIKNQYIHRFITSLHMAKMYFTNI